MKSASKLNINQSLARIKGALTDNPYVNFIDRYSAACWPGADTLISLPSVSWGVRCVYFLCQQIEHCSFMDVAVGIDLSMKTVGC